MERHALDGVLKVIPLGDVESTVDRSIPGFYGVETIRGRTCRTAS